MGVHDFTMGRPMTDADEAFLIDALRGEARMLEGNRKFEVWVADNNLVCPLDEGHLPTADNGCWGCAMLHTGWVAMQAVRKGTR